MEHNVRILPPEELIPALLPLLEETEAVPLVITGNSMVPFLVHGRDTVYLSKVRRPLTRGDMILYRRDSGGYILHRIVKVRQEGYDLVGDAQPVIERGIRPDQVLALVTAVRRKGKRIERGSLCWDFFEKVWICLIPLRPMLIACYTRLTRGRGAANGANET